jgi:glycosyltransferase involved in cell wall biosynthesis
LEGSRNYKKILIVSASFYPENSPRSFRTTELAKEFSRQGHDVTVYKPTSGRDYSSFENEHRLKIKNLGELKWKEIELKGGQIEFMVRRVIRRVLMLLFEYPDIELMFKTSKILKTEHGYDLLISIAVPYPIHWGIAKVRSDKCKIADCWVADCGDPYMGDTTDSFRKLFYFKYIEKWFCRKADYMTIPFDGARSAYYPEFHDKIRIIPQGFRLDNLNIPEYRKAFDYPVFAYAGGFIPGKRDPGPLLNFLSTCNRKFKFVVYTSQDGILLPAKKSLKEKLEIRGIIPREELLTVLSGMDFLINFDNNTHTQLPSKLIDYSITGRPVLNINSETDLSVLLEFMDGNYSRKMNLEPPDNYDIRVVAEKFTRLHIPV